METNRTEEGGREPAAAKRFWENPVARIAVIAAAALLIGFLAGFLPAWMTAQKRAKELGSTRNELELRTIQNLLGSATIEARRGNYEPARQAASEFFTRLGTEVERGGQSSLTAKQRDGMAPLFSQRDSTITLLARGDPAGAERLSDLYVGYMKALEGK